MRTLCIEERQNNAKDGTILLDLGAKTSGPWSPEHGQQAAEYKKHSLAGHYWGGIPQCKKPFRRVAADEAQQTFLHGLLDQPLASSHRKSTDWLISLVIHVVIVGAVVIAPLTFTQVIDFSNLRATYLAMPRPPAAAPAPRPPALQDRRVIRPFHSALYTMPTMIPRKIMEIKDTDIPDVNVGGVVGGVPGGESGGALGGILGGTQSGLATIPPPPAPKKAIYRVGGNFKAPREISKVPPDYPMIARSAHVQGTVIVDAVIDENGNVVHARVVSGPALLLAAALQAVMQWKYEPTYLDGTPVSISMEVQVVFHLT
jgi:periplasmic protein TonB